jgi:hypothetical protein
MLSTPASICLSGPNEFGASSAVDAPVWSVAPDAALAGACMANSIAAIVIAVMPTKRRRW